MTLAANLAHSRDACEYVLNIIKLKGANWDEYRGSSTSYEGCIKSGGSYVSCAVHKDAVDICLYDDVRPTIQTLSYGKAMLDRMRIIAVQSKLKKCGNCGEFSALAFIYLYDKGVRPLDWMGLIGGDHNFVVIGRENTDANDHANWGSKAVVCDPWGRGFRNGDIATGTYAASEFSTRMSGLLPFNGVKSLHRET